MIFKWSYFQTCNQSGNLKFNQLFILQTKIKKKTKKKKDKKHKTREAKFDTKYKISNFRNNKKKTAEEGQRHMWQASTPSAN